MTNMDRAREALRLRTDGVSVRELASKYGVEPWIVSRWIKDAVSELPSG